MCVFPLLADGYVRVFVSPAVGGGGGGGLNELCQPHCASLWEFSAEISVPQNGRKQSELDSF